MDDLAGSVVQLLDRRPAMAVSSEASTRASPFATTRPVWIQDLDRIVAREAAVDRGDARRRATTGRPR